MVRDPNDAQLNKQFHEEFRGRQDFKGVYKNGLMTQLRKFEDTTEFDNQHGHHLIISAEWTWWPAKRKQVKMKRRHQIQNLFVHVYKSHGGEKWGEDMSLERRQGKGLWQAYFINICLFIPCSHNICISLYTTFYLLQVDGFYCDFS